MMRGLMALALFGSHLATAATARAQWAGSLESGAGWAASALPTSGPAVMLRPALSTAVGRVDLSADGDLVWFSNPGSTVQWGSSGSLSVPLFRHLDVATGWDAAGESLPEGAATRALTGSVRAIRAHPVGDVWLRGALGSARTAAADRGLSSLGVGGSAESPRLRIRIGLTSTRQAALSSLYRDTIVGELPESVPFPDTLPRSTPRVERVLVRPGQPARHWTDGSVQAELRFGRASLHADVVARAGGNQVARGVWMTGGASFDLGNRIVMTASMGRAPGRPELDIPPGPAGFIGVRVRSSSPPKKPVVLAPEPGGGVLLTPTVGGVHIAIPLPDASSAEIAGDFSDWHPLPLIRAGDRWGAFLPLEPGTYHFNIRVDGGPWVVPPGVPSLPDEFGGEVGILLVDG